MKNLTKHLTLAALALSGLGVAPAMAQNANFANGDLILGFQSKGGTGADQTVLINLGNTATRFRNANTTNTNLFNFVNINSILDSTFGLGGGNTVPWYENTNLLFGAVGVWGNVAEGNLQNQDPEQTIYVSKSRTSNAFGLANESVKNSILNTPSASNHTAASNDIITLNGTFESQLTALQGAIAITTANTWEDFNVTGVGPSFTQSTAFSAYTGGIQQRFGTGSYGTFVTAGAVEGAIDLYRAQGQNNVTGQFGQGGSLRVPEFQGILTIDSSGGVDFIVTQVPEPSTLMLGAACLGFAIRRHRTATV